MASEEEIIYMYNPPRGCAHERCNNLFMEFIYYVVFPAIIVLVLLLLLAMVMFCNSRSCSKCGKYSALSTQTNDIEMENYNSIRRASANLRLMSQNRDTPMMGSRASSMTLDRSQRRPYRTRDSCSSAPDTLQRFPRNRLLDQSSLTPPPPYSINEEEYVVGLQRKAFPNKLDVPTPPPPPAYSAHSDEVFLGPDFLQPEMQTSVRYDDSPDYSATHSLLFHRSYEG